MIFTIMNRKVQVVSHTDNKKKKKPTTFLLEQPLAAGAAYFRLQKL